MSMKKIAALSLSLVLSMGMSVSAFAAEVEDDGIIDTNNQIITSAPGTVMDTGEPSDGYSGEKAVPYSDEDAYYFSDPIPVSTADGGKLYSHAERQQYGSLSGNVRTFRFYIYSKYEGSSTVEKISSEWYTTAKLRNSATLSLSASLGSTVSVSAGYETTWQNVSSPKKSWTNTNGTNATYEQSSFAISPDSDLYEHEVSIVHTSKVKLKGDAKPYSLSSGC